MFSVSFTISVVGVAPLKKLSSLDARFDHSRYYVVWLLMNFSVDAYNCAHSAPDRGVGEGRYIIASSLSVKNYFSPPFN